MKKAFIIHENEDLIEPLRVNLYDFHLPLNGEFCKLY